MAAFGTLTLFLAFLVAAYAAVASLVGARRGNQRLVDSGRAAVYGLTAVLSLSSVTILYAFVTGDYSIKYVQRYSDAASPIFYKITAYWGGLDGSILWWAFLLSVFSSIAVYANRHRHREIMPYVIATLMVIADFFLFLIVFHKNPFDTYLTQAPTSGEGLNPILQNAYMITHPPSLYTGLVGMSIPYAFAMGALISGHLDDAWILAVRRWTLMAWFFLSQGLTLGMLWAYEELGWGGFWAWDPVENAGFLPWLTATAFFHSTMVQERRGMLKIWNFSLVILTFFLTIFGTFMTRSGVVQSVHSFGEDKKLAMIFTLFMVTLLVTSFGFVIKRLPELRSRNKLDSVLSREGAFLVNNWILLFSAFFVLFATMFPTLSEWVTGERLNVGPPFFNKWMVPIGLILLFLTGVGPLIAWRSATVGHLRYQFTWPTLAALATVGVCVALGLRGPWGPLVCFGLCAFTTTSITQEVARGVSVRRRNTGADVMTALVGMIIRGRRRYGGYIVHIGIVLMFLGFAGQAYQKEEDLRLRPGQEVAFGRYTLRMEELRHDEDRQKEMITAEITVREGDKVIGKMRPARWFFLKSPQPTTEVALQRSPAEDLYLTLANYDFAENAALIKAVINPLIDWIWLGFVMLAFGTGIALLPESVLAPIALRAGAASEVGAAARAGMLLLALGIGAALALAPATALARTPGEIAADRKWLSDNLMCLCGCRARLSDCAMPSCGHKDPMFEEIDELLAAGQTREQIQQRFIAEHGNLVLLAPPDKGFNRLAWGVPYVVGAAGAAGLGLVAWRFARKPAAAPEQGAPAATPATAPAASSPAKGPVDLASTPTKEAADPDLEDRLEDELAKIDT